MEYLFWWLGARALFGGYRFWRKTDATHKRVVGEILSVAGPIPAARDQITRVRSERLAEVMVGAIFGAAAGGLIWAFASRVLWLLHFVK